MVAIPRGRLPRAIGENRERSSARIMPRAQQNHTNRNFHAACRPLRPPGPNICTRHGGTRHACARIFRSWVSRGEKRIEFLVQPRGLAGIKSGPATAGGRIMSSLCGSGRFWKACR